MPASRKYDEETRARAIRMCQDRISEGNTSKAAAYREVGELLGISAETLRGWVDRVLTDGRHRPDSNEAPADEIARLRRENAQLKRANEILKTASAFFAQAELDRTLGQ
ncbi:transposase [Leucobacter sp. wl10]|uniref:transposase n=1 Tax=Leucobacter sp. wl10 TaxID=2304677 RepID=UPI0013C348B1|nr:transposase [Leucobacter sp. wl10]